MTIRHRKICSPKKQFILRQPDLFGSTDIASSNLLPRRFSIRMRSIPKYDISVSQRFNHIQECNFRDMDILDGI